MTVDFSPNQGKNLKSLNRAIQELSKNYPPNKSRSNGPVFRAGRKESPVGPLAAFATAEGYSVKPNAHTGFHGYYFRMLTGNAIRRLVARRTTWSTGR